MIQVCEGGGYLISANLLVTTTPILDSAEDVIWPA